MAMEIVRRLTRGIGFNKFAPVVKRSWLYKIAMWIMAFLLIPDLYDLREFQGWWVNLRYTMKELICLIFQRILEYGRR
jgi:hypothetical protein